MFKRPGTYKVTTHVKYSGANYFKVAGYLSQPSNISIGTNNLFTPDNKLKQSTYSLFGSSKMKNHLHYSFVFDVTKPLTTFTMALIQKIKGIKQLEETKDIIVYGTSHSWIMIEKID